MAKLLYNLTGVEVSNAEITTGTKVYPKNYLVFVVNEAVIFLSDGVNKVKDLVAKAGTKPADDSALVAAIVAAKALDPANYAADSWATFLTAIETAETAVATGGKSAETIATAVAALGTTATEALADLRPLRTLLADPSIADLVEAEYDADKWSTWIAVYNAAVALLANAAATKANLGTMTETTVPAALIALNEE